MNISKDSINLVRLALLPIIVLILLSVAQAVLILLQARTLSIVIDAVFLKGASLIDVSEWMGWLLVIFISRGIVGWGCDFTAAEITVKIKTDLRVTLLEQIYMLGKEYIDQKQSGELISVLNEAIESLDGYLGQYIPQLLIAVLVPILILVYVIPLDILTVIVFFVTLPLMPFFMILIGSMSEKITEKQWNTLIRMRSFFADTLQGIKTLLFHNQYENYLNRLKSINERYRIETLKILRITFLSAFSLEFIATISTALVAVQAGLRLLEGKLDFVIAFFILLVAPEFYMPLRQLGSRFHAGIAGKNAIDKIMSILTCESPPKFSKDKYISISSLTSNEKLFDIRFDKVTYRYPSRNMDAVYHLTFDIKAGTNTAIVGQSGSGKSTIFYLILKILVPDDGQIMINGIDLQSISPNEWRSYISWVPQNPYIFAGTISENVLLANPRASMEELYTAAKKAHIHDFIQTLPLKYDSKIGEGGGFLSGGQVQRIALARAFLKNTPIVLLDEPTSNIDPELEEELRSSIQLLAKGKTVMIIAHRLATVVQSDQVIVMDKGQVVEMGKHRELIKQNCFYSRMMAPSIREIL